MLTGRGRVGVAERVRNRSRAVHRSRRDAGAPAALFVSDGCRTRPGAVLDPIVSLRQTIRLPPGATARLTFTTGYAETEADARRLIEKYHDRRPSRGRLALAGTHSQIELRHFGLTVDDTHLLPASRRPAALRRSAAARRRSRRARTGTASATVEVRHLRRPADRARCALRDDDEMPLVDELLQGARIPARARDCPSISSCSTSMPASYLQELQHAAADARQQPRAERGSTSPAACFCAAPI